MTENTQQHTQTQTAAEQDAKRQAYIAKRRKYYAEHAADNLRYRIHSAEHLLAMNGIYVLPNIPPLPWSEQDKRLVLATMEWVQKKYHITVWDTRIKKYIDEDESFPEGYPEEYSKQWEGL